MKTVLIDSSFLIDLAREIDDDVEGPAHRALANLKGMRLFVSPVTVAEMLEGAEDARAAASEMAKYHAQTIGWPAAERCALIQARSDRRFGENDAWQAAIASASGHSLLGHDDTFAGRPWLDYIDHRAS